MMPRTDKFHLPPRIVIQLPLTCLIIATLPSNFGKWAALAVVWGVTFQRISRPEAYLFLTVSLFFTGMNAAALSQGIFTFSHPDILGMPVYELTMWGFYVLHTRRLIQPVHSTQPSKQVWFLAIAYAACFALLHDPQHLTIATALLLAAGLALHHKPMDLISVGYMALLGACIEYTGVHSGEWHYPNAPAGGVPLWFLTLWGGVGFFLNRLASPLVAQYESRIAPSTSRG